MPNSVRHWRELMLKLQRLRLPVNPRHAWKEKGLMFLTVFLPRKKELNDRVEAQKAKIK